jgi:hypothetical protein
LPFGPRLDDWRACSEDIYELLHRCFSQLCKAEVSSELYQDLSKIPSTAHAAIRSVHHSKVQRKWRRLYTDASILKGAATLLEEGRRGSSDWQVKACGAIQDLDMAIIVCGYPGLDRLELIHKEICALQKNLPGPSLPESSQSSVSRSWSEQEAFCMASTSIQELEDMPTLTQYLSKLYSEAFVVRGFAADWPAIHDPSHQWLDARYLSKVAGPGRTVPVEIGEQYTEVDWHQDIISWTEFLDASGWCTTDTTDNSQGMRSEKPKYLAQHNLFRQFAQLESDIIVPDIVYSCPPAPSYFSTYRAPVDESGMETTINNAWIGPKGTTTPVHFDPYYNVYGEWGRMNSKVYSFDDG